MEFEVVGHNYRDTSEVPKDRDLFYHCKKCDESIPSVPNDNTGCNCGNVYIDRDYWRLVVADFDFFEVLRNVNDTRTGE